MDLLENLNDAQKEAVVHENGPLMIVAGAGTGKTTVITRRIARLIQDGFAKPTEILALTFTEKAAGEMEERVDQMLPMGYLDLSIQTFHAFCERVLREHGMEIGLSRDFGIVTELDAWLLVRKHFDKFDLKYYRPLGNPMRYLKGILQHFSTAKDSQVTPESYKEYILSKEKDLPQQELNRLTELANAFETYEAMLHEENVLDFGGLILYTLKLIRERPGILKKLQEQYKYVLVDEFQDTNAAQYELVREITLPENNITVVGDDDQSIYKFRGASLANILKFDTDYPDTKHVVLTQNYRSHQEILDASYKLIQNNNPNRLEMQTGLSKKLVAHREEGGKVHHLHFESLEAEAKEVSKHILNLRSEEGFSWRDVGILVRANDHALPFIDALERKGVPYRFFAMRGLYTKPVVLDVLAILRLVQNPYDQVSAYRVLNHPMYKISTRDLQELLHTARKQGKSLLHLNLSEIEISDETRAVLDSLNKLIEEHSELARRKRVTEMMIFTSRNFGLVEYINHLPDQDEKENFRFMQQMHDRMKSFESRHDDRSLKGFLEEFEHERDAGETGSLSADIEDGPDVVKIMTIHASKGLEFKHVFVVNLVDRRFPSQNRQDPIQLPDELAGVTLSESSEHLEEERRLMYVAMTRAKNHLYLTSAEDYGGARKKKLSRFLDELNLAEPAQKSDKSTFAEPEDDPESQREEVVFELPKFLSFTQLSAYRTCPLQYKFAHLLRIPVFGKHQMSFGKTMHAVLQDFFEEWLNTGSLPEESRMSELYVERWDDEWYPDDASREEYRQRGAVSFVRLFEQLEENTPKPFATEQPFTLKIENVVLKGQIDRIDEFDGGLHIIDYKTGKPKTLDQLRSDQKDQLYIYQMAVEEIWEKPVKKLSYYYLEDHSQVDFLGTEKELSKVRETIISTTERMKEGSFIPTPGMHCGFCDFADICEFRQS